MDEVEPCGHTVERELLTTVASVTNGEALLFNATMMPAAVVFSVHYA
jgi:hypothetical protein